MSSHSKALSDPAIQASMSSHSKALSDPAIQASMSSHSKALSDPAIQASMSSHSKALSDPAIQASMSSHSKALSDPAIQAPFPQPLEMNLNERCAVLDILSTPSRDFLVRNNAEKVPISYLFGKTIAIFLVRLQWMTCEIDYLTKELIDLYNVYNPSGDFEVVLVVVPLKRDQDKDREMFCKCFSKMPWLAIPCGDINSRERLTKLIRGSRSPIIDPEGMVLTLDGLEYLCSFGKVCFPFTREHLRRLEMENVKVWREKSLTRLLPRCLVDKKGKEVATTSALEGKTVGLLFYSEDSVSSDEFSCLKMMYKSLRRSREKFEIVMIKARSWEQDETAFRDASKKMPWLAWPSSDEKYKRISHELYTYLEHRMVMIGPNMEFIDGYGLEVFMRYGTEAFPFTRMGVAEKLVAIMRKTSLESLLSFDGNKHVVTSIGTKVDVSKLIKEKTVALFIGGPSIFNDFQKILEVVICLYEEIKKKDDKFEIVYVSRCEDETSYAENLRKMPWFALPFQDRSHDCCYKDTFDLFAHRMPYLLPFGHDGKILTKMDGEMLMKRGLEAYPFEDQLVDLTLCEIIIRNGWAHPLLSLLPCWTGTGSKKLPSVLPESYLGESYHYDGCICAT